MPGPSGPSRCRRHGRIKGTVALLDRQACGIVVAGVLTSSTADAAAWPGSFVAAIKAARDWGVVPIGYRAASAVSDPLAVGNGIRLNPPKDAVVSFSPGDVLVLIATTCAT